MIAGDDIRSRILEALPGATRVEVRDMTGTADHYEVRIVAREFEGLSLVERHRKVYAALHDVIGGTLHALSLKTLAPGD